MSITQGEHSMSITVAQWESLRGEHDALKARVQALENDRNALLIALANCAVDIEELMHGQYGDTAIMPLSFDRARALLAIKRP